MEVLLAMQPTQGSFYWYLKSAFDELRRLRAEVAEFKSLNATNAYKDYLQKVTSQVNAELVPVKMVLSLSETLDSPRAKTNRCGVCAEETSNQNHEEVGKGLPWEPLCDRCLEEDKGK